jgi:dihydroorotate dehydrogenase
MGFGFVEIGTVTPLPQPGNPRPRLFRIPQERAVVNRMGFNNPGAGVVASLLGALGRRPGPLGVNVGRNKATPNERAAEDYVAAFSALAPHADYAAINVSSPNTEGLRALQSAAELRRLVGAVAAARDRLPRRVPLLVKVSPDEPDDALDALADAAAEAGADGFVATNTTISRAGLERYRAASEAGGLSGAPLRERAERACARLFRRTAGKLPIVGVGGIFTAEDAYRRIRAGASLIQLYTALVYEGPGLPRKLCAGLARLVRRDGGRLADMVGVDAERLAR